MCFAIARLPIMDNNGEFVFFADISVGEFLSKHELKNNANYKRYAWKRYQHLYMWRRITKEVKHLGMLASPSNLNGRIAAKFVRKCTLPSSQGCWALSHFHCFDEDSLFEISIYYFLSVNGNLATINYTMQTTCIHNIFDSLMWKHLMKNMLLAALFHHHVTSSLRERNVS